MANAMLLIWKILKLVPGLSPCSVVAPNVEALDTIQKQIVKSGALEAEIQSANPEGDRVRGRIQIRTAGA